MKRQKIFFRNNFFKNFEKNFEIVDKIISFFIECDIINV